MVKRYDHNWYENEMEQCEGGDYVLHSDYAALERRLEEMQEAVRWLDETLAMLLTRTVIFDAFGPDDDTEEICESFYAARAAMDALVGEGN